MSVAASKLSDPVLTHKLPVSLSKRFKTQSTAEQMFKKEEFRVNSSYSTLVSQPLKKMKVLAIDETLEMMPSSENRKCHTIENDSLIRAGKESYKVLMSVKKRNSVKLRNISNISNQRKEKRVRNGRDEF